MLERLAVLMRSGVPGGDLATLIERAVGEKLQRLEARRFGKTQAPRKTVAQSATVPGSRYVPAAVRRAVHERDGGRCRFVDEQGRRCPERNQLARPDASCGLDPSMRGSPACLDCPLTASRGSTSRSPWTAIGRPGRMPSGRR